MYNSDSRSQVRKPSQAALPLRLRAFAPCATFDVAALTAPYSTFFSTNDWSMPSISLRTSDGTDSAGGQCELGGGQHGSKRRQRGCDDGAWGGRGGAGLTEGLGLDGVDDALEGGGWLGSGLV